MLSAMDQQASRIIDHFGGTSAVARLMKTPVSTVHSWRVKGFSDSRLDHLRLAIEADGQMWPVEFSDSGDGTGPGTPSPDMVPENIGTDAETASPEGAGIDPASAPTSGRTPGTAHPSTRSAVSGELSEARPSLPLLCEGCDLRLEDPAVRSCIDPQCPSRARA